MPAKQIRWKCEQCNSGVLGPSKPRMNDVRRYCLPCSAKTGKLVQRVAPRLERQRQDAKAKTQQRNASKRATVAKKRNKKKAKAKVVKRITTIGQEGFVVEREAKRIWKLLEPYHNGKAIPKIEWGLKNVTINDDGTIMRGGRYAGLAYIGENRIWLKAHCSWETLAHELVHMAVGVRRGEHNRKAHDKVFYDCLRDITQRRFKVNISFFEVTRYGYAVDNMIEYQLVQLGAFKIFEKANG